MKVSYIDLKSQNQFLHKDIFEAIDNVFHNNDFILGKAVCDFEEKFAHYCGCKYAVGVNSGTDALFLSLLSLGIGPQDEVICPVYTYIATALSISYTGAKPVFVDIDEQTFNIDPQKIERRINKRTKAIIAVHLYGQPADMSPMLRLAQKYRLKVIEDAAQAHGAKWLNNNNRWQIVGSLADVGCFSFYPTKNLSGCGDAGMITTNQKSTYNKLLMLRDQGRKLNHRYVHHVLGYNSRLDSIQAAILRQKLKYLDGWNGMRKKVANFYSQLLKYLPGITVPYQSPFAQHVFHIYALRIRKRDGVYKYLKKNGVGGGITYHLPLHRQNAYRHLGYKLGDFPTAERVAKEILCLPIYPHLNQRKIKFVVNIIKKAIE